MIVNRKATSLAVLAVVVGLGGFSAGASAATKTKTKTMTLEQAWKICKAKVDKEYGPNTTESNAQTRYHAGAACMEELGHKL
jgi:hypothetical protein